MPVIFPHVNRCSHSISEVAFRNAWAQLIVRYPGNGQAHELPRLPSHDPLRTLVSNNQQFSLEYLCRMLVPNGYRNGMHATKVFLAANKHIVSPTLQPVTNPATGRRVQGVQLLPPVSTSFNSHEDIDIEALFEADVDELEEVDKESPAIVLPVSPNLWGNHINYFVDQINIAPYQPMYRNNIHGAPVTGWDARLHAYFWPKPGIGVAATATRLQPILARCQALAKLVQTCRPWNSTEEAESVVVANEIFKWGGVPQDPIKVTWQNVRNVFEAALTGTVPVPSGTLMNSGWTKVAAFATAHLGNSAQVIWDSRVSTSIVRRLDNIFKNARLKAIPPAYSGIGIVAGQGGTRKNPPPLNFKWRNGYGRWDAQFVGSAFVQEVCNILNTKKIRMTRPDGTTGNWNVRCVEMVLFGDGY